MASFTLKLGRGRAWLPSDIANLELWLDPAQISGVTTDGTAISSWTDLSGAAHHFLQGTGANQPVLKTNIVNGKPVVRFDGVNDDMTCAGFAGDSTRTVFIVAKQNSTTDQKRLMTFGISNVSSIADVSGNWGWINNGAAANVSFGGAATNSGYSVIAVRVNSLASLDGWVNGGTATNLDPNDGVANAACTIGSNGGGATQWDGDVAFVLSYSSALSNTDVDTVRNYLGATFNLGFGSLPPDIGNVLDFAPYTRVAPGEGFDPANSTYLEPAFAESPLRDGGPLINIDAHNREITVPLSLNATTKQGLHDLIQRISTMCLTQNSIEWKDQGASISTYFDMQAGRLDVEYNFRRAQKFWCFATLHMWTGPHGNGGPTAADAVYASITGSGMLRDSAAAIGLGISGDSPARAKWQVTTGSTILPHQVGRWVGVAAIPSSYTHLIPAASITGGTAFAGSAAPTYYGGSGAQASQYREANPVATGAPQILGQFVLSPADSYVGRNRVYAVGRSRQEPNMAMYLSDWEGNRVGASVIASGTRDWHLYDLGVVNVPTVGRPSQLTMQLIGRVPSQTAWQWGMASGFPIIYASQGAMGFHINQFIVVPEANHSLLIDDVDMPSQIVYDNFVGANASLSDSLVPAQHIADSGHSWASGFYYGSFGGGSMGVNIATSLRARIQYGGHLSNNFLPGGNGLNIGVKIPSLGIDLFRQSAGISIDTVAGFHSSNASVATQWFELRKSQLLDTLNLGVRYAPSSAAGGPYFAITAFTTAATVCACVALPTQHINERMRVYAEYRADRIVGWLYHDEPWSPTPMLASLSFSPTSGYEYLAYNPGDPGMGWNMPSQSIPGNPKVTVWDYRVESLPTQRIAPRDVYTFDGVANEAHRRPLTGDIQHRLTHKLRGQIPKIPIACQTYKLIGFAVGLPEGVAGDITDLSFGYQDQYHFAR